MERLTRGKAIRAKCLDCCCGNSAEVRRCSITTCPLWIYRMGNEIKENTPKLDENPIAQCVKTTLNLLGNINTLPKRLGQNN